MSEAETTSSEHPLARLWHQARDHRGKIIAASSFSVLNKLFDLAPPALIGAAVDKWSSYLTQPGARLHLYGKGEVRAGRKMGHVNWVGGAPPVQPDA